MTRSALTSLFAFLALLVGVTPAAAADKVFNFDNLPAGQEITNQLAADGVVFNGPTAFGFPGDLGCGNGPAVVVPGPGIASSPPKAIKLSPACGGAEFDTYYGTVGAFSIFRSRITVHISDVSGNSGRNVYLRAYDTRRNLLAQDTVALVGPPGRTASVNVGSPKIAFFAITQQLGNGAGGAVAHADDLTVDEILVPPSPEIALVRDTGNGLRMRQGGTATVGFSVLRFNNSNGNVQLSTAGVPSGIAGQVFGPSNPVGGSAFLTPATLALTTSSSAATGDSTFTVTAQPLAPGAGSKPDSVTVPLEIVTPFRLGGATSARVSPCAPSSAALYLNVEAGYTDPITLSVSSSSPSVAWSLPGTFQPGFSAPLASIPIMAPRGTATGDGNLTITATSGPFTSVHTIAVDRYPGAITSITLADDPANEPSVVLAPMLARSGQRLRVVTDGLCADSTFQFGADSPGVAPEERLGDGRTVIVRVPLAATTGPLTYTTPDGPAGGAPGSAAARTIGVDGFRNYRGFSFPNFSSGNLAFDDYVDLFGKSETYVQVNPCAAATALTLGLVKKCAISLVPKPTALIFFLATRDIGEKGNCYGVSMASFRLWERQVPYSRFDPAGAFLPIQLTGATGPSAPLRQFIRLQQLSQKSTEGIVARSRWGSFDGPTKLRQRVESIIAKGRPALMAIHSGDSGHAVLGYAVTPQVNGSYTIETYDPNQPYVGGSANTASVTNSRIVVNSTGWVFAGVNWNWTGMFNKIGAIDPADVPLQPNLPDSLKDVVSLVLAGVDAGAVTGADGKPLAGVVRLPALSALKSGGVDVLIPAGKRFRVALKGAGSAALLGGGIGVGLEGSAKAVEADPRAGSANVVDARPGTTLSTIEKVPGGERVAAATFRNGGDGSISLGTDGRVEVGGTGSVSLQVAETSTHASSLVDVAPFRLRSGERATVALSATSARASVRGPRGTRTLTLRTTRPAAATIPAIKASATRTELTLRTRVRPARGVTASISVTWQALRGARVAASKTLLLTPDQAAALTGGSSLRLPIAAPVTAQKLRVIVSVSGAGADAPAARLTSRSATVKVR